jgi:hypothetical protein
MRGWDGILRNRNDDEMMPSMFGERAQVIARLEAESPLY